MANKITPRRPNFDFSVEIPRHWLESSPFKTHLCNSFTLLFPTGEKFFIRSIQKFMSRLENEELRLAAKAFIQQEAQHAIEHDKFLKNLREQGYDIDPILKLVDEVITKFVENNTSQSFQLALTAGFEHLTSLLAEIGLSENFFQEATPVMKSLFEWHAMEEIEHRAVAFDVLQSVDSSYRHRVAGLISAYAILSGLCALVTANLLWQDKLLFKKKTIQDGLDVFFLKHQLFPKALSIFTRYLKPSFHPEDESHLESLLVRFYPRESTEVA
ncbi:MAG: metal-dependent hydrolase [Bacteriovoracaceae bacterium]|nr:metal-dependent hydrolase [Bacteriovoracaceae bacterium]